jgi:hypothetical protein
MLPVEGWMDAQPSHGCVINVSLNHYYYQLSNISWPKYWTADILAHQKLLCCKTQTWVLQLQIHGARLHLYSWAAVAAWFEQ